MGHHTKRTIDLIEQLNQLVADKNIDRVPVLLQNVLRTWDYVQPSSPPREIKRTARNSIDDWFSSDVLDNDDSCVLRPLKKALRAAGYDRVSTEALKHMCRRFKGDDDSVFAYDEVDIWPPQLIDRVMDEFNVKRTFVNRNVENESWNGVKSILFQVEDRYVAFIRDASGSWFNGEESKSKNKTLRSIESIMHNELAEQEAYGRAALWKIRSRIARTPGF
jgi:hypothetical protein